MKTLQNNLKRAIAEKIFLAMFTVGNGSKDPLRHLKRRPEFARSFNLIQRASKFLFLIAYCAMNICFEFSLENCKLLYELAR